MNMSLIKYVVQYGFSISLLINAALFIPQILTLIKRKSTLGVSLVTFLGFNIIQVFTMLHGLFEKDYLLAGGYFLSIITCGCVSCLIVYYKYIRVR